MKPEMHSIEPDDSRLRRYFAFSNPGFEMPANYFDEFHQSVFWQLQKQSDPEIQVPLSAANPFTIPQNYFSEFNTQFFKKRIEESDFMEQELVSFDASELGKILAQKGPGFTIQPILKDKPKRITFKFRMAYAAAAVLFVSVGIWYVNKPTVKLIEPPFQNFDQASNELSDDEFIQILEEEDIQPEQLADFSDNSKSENNSKQSNPDSLKSSNMSSNESSQPADEDVEQFLLEQADESLIESL